MLEVKSVRKAFGNIAALDGVSLRAGRGETVGLLGPNGAGKTTTVSMNAGLLRPDSVEVLIDGRPLRDLLQSVQKFNNLPIPCRRAACRHQSRTRAGFRCLGCSAFSQGIRRITAFDGCRNPH